MSYPTPPVGGAIRPEDGPQPASLAEVELVELPEFEEIR